MGVSKGIKAHRFQCLCWSQKAAWMGGALDFLYPCLTHQKLQALDGSKILKLEFWFGGKGVIIRGMGLYILRDLVFWHKFTTFARSYECFKVWEQQEKGPFWLRQACAYFMGFAYLIARPSPDVLILYMWGTGRSTKTADLAQHPLFLSSLSLADFHNLREEEKRGFCWEILSGTLHCFVKISLELFLHWKCFGCEKKELLLFSLLLKKLEDSVLSWN